ncbi:MAG: adenylate/guanylate cyclase domain-containing protein, partial [Actinobacteria bacterium]|nr:adenylate/guanylate cyclase domain-containing protein [Actinomycetota bacterium]
MASLEDLTPEARDELAALARELADNPNTRESFLRLTKTARPNMPIGEIDLKDDMSAKFEAAQSRMEQLEGKLREKEAMEELERRRNKLLRSKGVKEDARACVEMALEMQERMLVLQNRWRERGFENPFIIRIGMNTGYCNVGNFGSDQRLSYTIIGGEVNVAQRLEASSDPGGILISHDTFVHVDDLVAVEERQAVNLKGIDRSIKTYAVKGRKAEADKPLRLSHAQGV